MVDTKKWGKGEFTCQRRAWKTRRKEERVNLRVWEEARKHEEMRKEEIYVSDRRPEDTKKWGKGEFTCQRRAWKTRRNEERENLRVWEEPWRHEEMRKEVIYVSEESIGDTKK